MLSRTRHCATPHHAGTPATVQADCRQTAWPVRCCSGTVQVMSQEPGLYPENAMASRLKTVAEDAPDANFGN